MKEHNSEIEELPTSRQTRSQHQSSITIRHKSAICDHVHQQNHVINLGDISTVDGEDNQLKRQIRESIAICQHGKVVMNRDEGLYDLPHIWDNVLPPIKLGGGGARRPRSIMSAVTYHQVAAQSEEDG